MKNKYLLFSFIVISITSLSCRKDKGENKIDNQTTSMRDNALSQNMFDDVKKVVEEAADDEGSSTAKSGYFFGACGSVSISPNWIDSTQYWPKTMTIDFGTTNCLGNDGINRRGKLIVTLTDRYRNTGSVLSVQPQNYYINDYYVEGTKTITNNGRNGANNLSFTVKVMNGKITSPTGEITTWNSTRTNEWIAGESTTWFLNGLSGICDDIYLISGTANGINKAGLPYTVNITSPLRKEICCRWIVSGSLDIIPSGLLTRSVDFGTGTCDNLATVTIAGNSFIVPMN